MMNRHGCAIGLFVFMGLFSGCGAKMADSVTAMKEPPPGSEAEIAVIAADPIAYMNKSLAEARKVKTARMNFQRQDRVGLVPELRPMERMRTNFREEPFSVRFTWQDEKSEYLQAVYVEGTNDNKVALLPRSGLFGSKPSVVSYPVNFAVAFGKSKKPITDFGPRLMLERLFDRIEKAKAFGGAKIRHIGVAKVGPGNEECHHIELLFPKQDEFPCKLLDLYVNTHTRLPVAVYLWLTEEKRERTDHTLDAMYIYGEMETNITLSENDFVIDAQPAKGSPKKTKKSAPSKKGAAATSAPSKD